MKISIKKIENFNIVLVLLLYFIFMSTKFDDIVFIFYIIIAFFLYLLKNKKGQSIRIENRMIKIILAVLISIGIATIVGMNFMKGACVSFLFLFIVLLCFDKNEFDKNSIANKIFYYVFLIFLIYFLYYAQKNRLIGTNIFYFPNTIDKNYSGVVVFLFFSYCLKVKKRLGEIVGIIYALLLNSRLLLLSVILVIVLNIIFNSKNKFIKINLFFDKIIQIIKNNYFIFIIALTIVMTIFSFIMVYKVSTSSITDYQESLYDESNAIRLRANVYAVNEIKKNIKLLVSGYDYNILNVMGIDKNLKAVSYEGYRLVQPHNFVLNLFLRYGVLLTLLYVYLLSKILSKYTNKNNFAIIISYLVMNMIMHSLLINIYLLFFVYVLSIERKEGVE